MSAPLVSVALPSCTYGALASPAGRALPFRTARNGRTISFVWAAARLSWRNALGGCGHDRAECTRRHSAQSNGKSFSWKSRAKTRLTQRSADEGGRSTGDSALCQFGGFTGSQEARPTAPADRGRFSPPMSPPHCSTWQGWTPSRSVQPGRACAVIPSTTASIASAKSDIAEQNQPSRSLYCSRYACRIRKWLLLTGTPVAAWKAAFPSRAATGVHPSLRGPSLLRIASSRCRQRDASGSSPSASAGSSADS